MDRAPELPCPQGDLFATRGVSPLEGLSDQQLLERLLGHCAEVVPSEAATHLLQRFGSFPAVLAAGLDSLALIVGPAAALELRMAHDVARRLAAAEVARRQVISSWSALCAYLKLTMAHLDREAFRVLFLDKKNQLIADEVMGEGTVDHAPVYPREVMRRALELSASAAILVHNHPSGDPTPSSADIDMTRQVVEAGKALRISIHDHVVVGRDGIASFKALGLI
jgi:DNA repair protein RadC